MMMIMIWEEMMQSNIEIDNFRPKIGFLKKEITRLQLYRGFWEKIPYIILWGLKWLFSIKMPNFMILSSTFSYFYLRFYGLNNQNVKIFARIGKTCLMITRASIEAAATAELRQVPPSPQRSIDLCRPFPTSVEQHRPPPGSTELRRAPPSSVKLCWARPFFFGLCRAPTRSKDLCRAPASFADLQRSPPSLDKLLRFLPSFFELCRSFPSSTKITRASTSSV